MSGNKRGSSFDILFDQEQEYSNTKKMKFDSTKKSDLIKAEQIESTNMQHIQPISGATMLEPMTSSEQILMKEIDDISNTDLLLEESFFSPIFKIRTGKSLTEALIFAQTNPQYDDRLFIELRVHYMKIPSSNLGRTCCVHKLFLTFRTIFVHNMFSPCSAKRRASDKDLPVLI